jgi:uncharacterized protein (DUF1684 family)
MLFRSRVAGSALSSRRSRRFAASAVLAAFVLGLMSAGCGSADEASSYRQTVLQERLQKDTDLRSRDSRVLSTAAKGRFEGLRYFAVDTTYRFVLPLQRLARPETMRVAQRTGAPAQQVKVGTVEVPLPGGPYNLAVFRPRRAADSTLWIPFSDETTGRQTYGAGRYLDAPLREDGTVLVDFNRAYNPLCDYNPQKYNCAVAPPTNHLPVAVEAGEKKSLIQKGYTGRRATS